jgi:hypothetical protein
LSTCVNDSLATGLESFTQVLNGLGG